MNQLTRREFLQRVAGLGLSATAIALLDGCGILPAPTSTLAKIPRIGYLASGTPSSTPSVEEGFRRGLRDLGHVEGKNIAIENRWVEGNDDRLPALDAWLEGPLMKLRDQFDL